MTEVTWAVSSPRLLSDQSVARAVQAALAHGGRPGTELAVTFVGEEFLTGLHEEHLADPSPTDVITFDLGEIGRGPAGEIYVSVARAEQVAGERGGSPERELTLYVVHGVLHLCGFDDIAPDERARMRAAEAEVLLDLGFPPDSAPHEWGTE